MDYTIRTIGRFESFIDRSGGPDSCHKWTGWKGQHGHGRFWVHGKQVGAHRFAWEQVNGPIPNGLQIHHSCDHGWCVNTRHMSLGTQADNMQDRIAHGRGYAKGQDHPRAVLTNEQVQEAYRLRLTGWSWYRLADRYHVARTTVSRAVTHHDGSWATVETGDVPQNIQRRLTPENVAQARQMVGAGMTHRAIAFQFGVSRPAITRALRKLA